MRRKLPVILFVAGFGILLLLGVARALLRGGGEESVVEGVAVGVEHPVRRTMEEVLRYPGTLTPKQTITVVPKVTGRVEKIHVAEGDRVAPGRLLVTIDAESVSLQAEQAYAAWQAAEAQTRKAERGVRNEELESAQATVAQAEAEMAVAQRNFERSKRLYEAGTIPRAKYEESETAINAAKTTLENAQRSVKMMEEGATTEDIDSVRAQAEALKAQYDLATIQMNNARVSAPAFGTVAKVFVDPGNLVSAGTPLLALVSEDPIFVRIAVPEKHYGRFSSGAKGVVVRVSPVAYDSKGPFTGTVEMVSPTIDAVSRTFLVEASVANREGLLRPGMYANTEIVIDRHADALSVPASALVLRDSGEAVFAVDSEGSQHAREHPVGTGLRSEGFVEILTGISEDDWIVVEGNAFLEDGQMVRILRQQ